MTALQVSYEFFTPRKLPILFLDLAQGKLDESFGVLLLGQPWMSWGGGLGVSGLMVFGPAALRSTVGSRSIACPDRVDKP